MSITKKKKKTGNIKKNDVNNVWNKEFYEHGVQSNLFQTILAQKWDGEMVNVQVENRGI